MKIKSIKMNNFRQYKGTQNLEFSTDEEKNVTVILGKNTSGKTTLIQAFLWCFYEVNNFQIKALLNYEILAEMKINDHADVDVEVTLIHDGTEYTIMRKQGFTKIVKMNCKPTVQEFKISYKGEDGNTNSVKPSEVENTINKILPKGLSDYFFFDGERLKEINKRKDVVDAVHGLMGIDIINGIVQRFKPKGNKDSVIAKLNQRLDLNEQSKSAGIKEELASAQDELKLCEDSLANINEQIVKFEILLEEQHQKLLENKGVKESQEKKRELERKVLKSEESVLRKEEKFLKVFNKGISDFLATVHIHKALDVMGNAVENGEGIPEMKSKSIDYIIERNRCICGCEIPRNSEVEKNILHEKSLLPPVNIGTLIRETKKDYLRIQKSGVEFASDINDEFKLIREEKRNLGDYKQELSNVSQKIMGHDDVGAIELRYNDAKRSLNAQNQKKGSFETKRHHSEKNIERLTRQLNSLVDSSEKNAKTLRAIEYATEMYEHFKEIQEKKEKEVKEELLVHVNKIFSEMYHGTRTVTINEKYQINLVSTIADNDFTSDESKGLETVKNFSFVAGLVAIARGNVRKTASNDDYESIDAEPYPFVMDAPFSNVDEEHIRKISGILPGVGEQVILSVMEKDWTHAQDVMNDKVGKIYSIQKVNNSDVHSEFVKGTINNV